ncbi:MAG: mechanosensitive ion channel family protein [Promethearchaeota archaeon]
MIFQDFLQIVGEWFAVNFINIIVIVIIIFIVFIVYKVIKRQIMKIGRKTRLGEGSAKGILKIVRFLFVLIIISTILVQFTESLGLITTLFTLVGGTIIGFAAMNTLGNFIAGLIIMTSRPFSVGDRILFNDKLADVIDIKLMYTILEDLDGIKISVPNQKVLSNEVYDLGKKNYVRRNIAITAGYDEDRKKVEDALLEAAESIPQVLKEPKPYVWITDFKNYAVEYRIYVFIQDLKEIPKIQAELYAAVLDSCNKHSIEIQTPRLIRTV